MQMKHLFSVLGGLSSLQAVPASPMTNTGENDLLALSARHLHERGGPVCGNLPYSPITDAVTCLNRLNDDPNGVITVKPGLNNLYACFSGNGKIVLQGLCDTTQNIHKSSIAFAVKWVLDHCSINDQGITAGACDAYGNGCVRVGVEAF